MNGWMDFQQHRKVQELPIALQAGLWGLLGGSALVVGAAIAWFVALPPRIVAAVMAIGSGVLISAVAFDLMDEAYNLERVRRHGTWLSGGAAVYTAANIYISRRVLSIVSAPATIRTSASNTSSEGNGLAIAVGALLDGIPDRRHRRQLARWGRRKLSHRRRRLPVQRAGRPFQRRRNAQSGPLGGLCLRRLGQHRRGIGHRGTDRKHALAGADPNIIAATNAIAAGAILAMLVDTMIPEAFESTHEYSGLITVVGFLAAFVLSKLGG